MDTVETTASILLLKLLLREVPVESLSSFRRAKIFFGLLKFVKDYVLFAFCVDVLCSKLSGLHGLGLISNRAFHEYIYELIHMLTYDFERVEWCVRCEMVEKLLCAAAKIKLRRDASPPDFYIGLHIDCDDYEKVVFSLFDIEQIKKLREFGGDI